MRAAVLRGPRDLRVESVPVPEPARGEARVRVETIGLCGTDYRIWTGDRPVTYPLVMGHEFLGRVDALGAEATGLALGDRVVVEPNYSCGACPLCREGNGNLCLRRTAVGIDVHGGFAEAACVPAQLCWRVPGALASEDAVLTEPLAVVVRAVHRGEPRAGDSAAVVGAGTLGLLALQVLRARGLRVLVVSRSTRRFALARELGAEATHALGDGALDEAARAFSGREGVGLVVETAGTPEAVGPALGLVRPGGRVVLTGLPHAPSTVSFFSVVRREITVVGSMIYRGEFPEALALVERGAVRTRPLITHSFPLTRIGEAFAAHEDLASIKVTVVPDGTAP